MTLFSPFMYSPLYHHVNILNQHICLTRSEGPLVLLCLVYNVNSGSCAQSSVYCWWWEHVIWGVHVNFNMTSQVNTLETISSQNTVYNVNVIFCMSS